MAVAATFRFVHGRVGVLNELDAVSGRARSVPHDDADTGPLFEVYVIEGKRLSERVEESASYQFCLGRVVESFGQVEKLVATKPTDGVHRPSDPFEAVSNRDEQLVANKVAVGVVHPFKVIEVKQQHRARPALAGDSFPGLDEVVIEECSVREPGEWVVKRLVRKL